MDVAEKAASPGTCLRRHRSPGHLRTEDKGEQMTYFPLRVGKNRKRVTVRIDAKGYPVFKSGFYRDVRVHRAVAEAMLGRELRKDEDVHHRDGNKRNWDIENLQVLGKSQHGWESAVQHWFVPRLLAEREKKEWEDAGILDA